MKVAFYVDKGNQQEMKNFLILQTIVAKLYGVFNNDQANVNFNICKNPYHSRNFIRNVK